MKKCLLLAGIAAAISYSSVLEAMVPFNTMVRNYVYIGKPGLNSAPNQVFLYTAANPAAAGGDFSAGIPITYTNGTAQNINAASISPLDGYMYGMEYAYAGPNSASGTLYRVGADAEATKIGTIQPPTSADAGRPVTYSFVNTASGNMDNAGTYWFTAYTFTDLNPPLSGGKIDVFLGRIASPTDLTAGTTAIVPAYYHLDISDPILQTGYANFMSAVYAFAVAGQPTSNANGGWQDMDLNPADGKFYSYISFPNAPTTPVLPGNNVSEPPLNSHLVKIDVVNSGGYWGKVTLVNTTPNTSPNYEEDGAYFDGAGNYNILFTNGQYAQVNTSDGTLNTMNASVLPLSSGEMRGDLATNSAITPLPVKLISFDANAEKSSVMLDWKIADWQELDHITIERSADAKSFHNTVTMKPTAEAGNYTDEAPLTLGYYRLKMIGINGASIYSPVLTVAMATDGTALAYPNPAKEKLTIRTPTASVAIALTDMSGQVLSSKVYDATAGMCTLDLATIPTGAYLLTVKDAGTGKQILAQMVNKQ